MIEASSTGGIIEKGRTEMPKNNRIALRDGSGNVFKDLGFPNPEREQVKARLTLQIYRLIKDRGLTQEAVGEILGIKQPHVSGLMRGHSGSFSVERLIDFLTSPPFWRVCVASECRQDQNEVPS